MRRPLAQPIPFARYRLVERIGHGGMATVYRAQIAGPAGFERDIVVKMMLPALADNPAFVEMFMNEAKLAARLAHPNIAQVHELGIVEGTVFIAMEFIDGVDLAELTLEQARRGARLPLSAACFVVRELCDALAYAHERMNLVHRDVSPSNVMLGRDGSVKLLDFGIAKLLEDGVAGRTQTGTLKGKYGYMAPEQAAGRHVDHRADIFSTGIILHELLTGKRLFKGQSDLETLRRVSDCNVPRPSEINRDVLLALDAVALRALAREPADRYSTAQEMGEALAEFATVSRPKFAEIVRAYLPRERAHPVSASEVSLTLAQAPTAVQGGATTAEPPRRPGFLRRVAVAGAGALAVLTGTLIYVEARPAPGPQVLPLPSSFVPTATETQKPTQQGDVTVAVDSVPPGAAVRRTDDGATLGTTPLLWRTPRGEGRVLLELSRPGFKAQQVQTPLDRDSRILVTLAAEAPPPRPAAPRPVRRHKTPNLKSGDLVDPFKGAP